MLPKAWLYAKELKPTSDAVSWNFEPTAILCNKTNPSIIGIDRYVSTVPCSFYQSSAMAQALDGTVSQLVCQCTGI